MLVVDGRLMAIESLIRCLCQGYRYIAHDMCVLQDRATLCYAIINVERVEKTHKLGSVGCL